MNIKSYVSSLLMLLALSLPTAELLAEDAVSQADGVAKEINLIIAAKQHPFLAQTNFTNRAEDVDNLYKLHNQQLVWLGNEHAEKHINDALALLNNASAEGLEPARYDSAALQQRLKSALALPADAYKELALYDTALSVSVVRYLHDLHYGRVNPQGMSFNLKLRQKKLLDIPALIKDSVAQDSLAQLAVAAEPKLRQYQKLKTALVQYRELANQFNALNLVIDKSVKPGNELPQSEALRELLIALGDLPADKSGANHTTTKVYNNELAAGVKKFQLRHGMNGDGVLGAGTVAALNVPLRDRVTQIELAMERLRWLPEPSAGRSIIVNIPSFQLWAFDDIQEIDASILNMRVVVGKAMETQTPVLMAKMSFIDFMPFWNVPNKITKDEILPKLLKNGSYLAKENMELVNSFGNEVKPVPFSSDSIAKIKQGLLRVRQRPGKKNALGRVKFIFPNKDDVYLHDTPANALFSKSRRDFSHGCVRVANPDKLAEFALKDQWTSETIQKAMSSPKTQRVLLKKSIPVLFFYVTAYFDKNDKLAFYSDIYGHDAVLLAALKSYEDLSDQAIFAPPPAPKPTVLEPLNPDSDKSPEGLPEMPEAINNPQTINKPVDVSSPVQPIKKPLESVPSGLNISG
ncbi:MAG: L,D-transpeptidase family protein [Methylococcales bacterium]